MPREDHGHARVGELLRDHRRAAGLTQEQLAERAGVSPRSISELERGGGHVARRDTLALLARALDLSDPARSELVALVEAQRRSRPPGVAGASAEIEPSAHTRRHNIPRALTSFVGRESEMTSFAATLAATPLLTLVGAGGVGKTRLAHELAGRYASNFADGSWLVELAGLADGSLLPDAIAAAVGLHDVQTGDVTHRLIEHLRPKELLLVLDNCEHLIERCAALVVQLLRECSGLHVLTTSREPLAIMGEAIRHVTPLDLPDDRQAPGPEGLMRSAAVRLFLERARAVNHRLVLTADNASAIARICLTVDGIPLALELAAARTRVLTVEQLAQRIDLDSRVLVVKHRGGLPRQRDMHATLDWSHDMLGYQEQILLRRLSVFAGGWPLEIAEEVCSHNALEPSAVLDLLAQLVDRSMVLVDAGQTAARFRLLEPIRQYASERLESSGEAATYRARHAHALLGLVLRHEGGGPGPDEVASLDRLEVEHANLRVALRWALSHHPIQALHATAALFRFWERRGHFQEGCVWLEQALEHAPDAPRHIQSWALNSLAFLYWQGEDLDRAWPVAQKALAVSREAGTARDVGQALLNLGMIAYLRNQPGTALTLLKDAVAAAREGEHRPQLSLALSFLARTLLWVNGPFDRAVAEAVEESLRLARRAQSLYATGHALTTFGDICWSQGNTERASTLWREALQVRHQLTDRRGIAGCLERLALVLAASDSFEAAAWHFGAAAAQHRALGIALRHDEEIHHEHLLELTRQNLGKVFSEAWSSGQASAPAEAVARALDDTRCLATSRCQPSPACDVIRAAPPHPRK